MSSIEELEEALDAMEGIDTDGGSIDTSDVREARVRSAYLEWCKEYGKEPDESRFPTFTTNFLAMEEYAQENNREMVLNKYADCTEEEYRAIIETPGESYYIIALFGKVNTFPLIAPTYCQPQLLNLLRRPQLLW